jgi:lysophospholipase L1-like esterase
MKSKSLLQVQVLVILPLALLFLAISCSPVSRYIDSDDVLYWEPDIARFDSLNAIEPSGPGTLLVTGSSSIRLWDSIQTDLAPYTVMQRGYGGARLSDFDHYAERVIKPGPFKAIMVFIANDITGGEQDRSPREVFLMYKELVKTIRERNPGTPVFWIEVTPTPSRWQVSPRIREAGELIRDYCEKNDDLHFIDTYDYFITDGGIPDSTLFREDMLHLNREGYKTWASIQLKALSDTGVEP